MKNTILTVLLFVAGMTAMFFYKNPPPAEVHTVEVQPECTIGRACLEMNGSIWPAKIGEGRRASVCVMEDSALFSGKITLTTGRE